MATTRNAFQREHDRAEIARLYLVGTTQQAIADALKISRQTVTKDLKVMQQRWIDQADTAFDARRAEELARIDNLERTYWEAWERSLREVQRSETATIKTEDKQTSRASIRREERLGDPRYLEGVRWCIEQRAKILGIYAATKIDHSGELAMPIVTRIVAEIPAEDETDEHADS